MSSKVPLTFRIFQGDTLLREERLTLGVIKLGKVASAHLRLDDEAVSRMHAVIEANSATDVTIIDLGSTRGTFVNGQRINKARLATGDTITIGATRLEVAIGELAPAADVASVIVAAPVIAPPVAFTPPPVPPPMPAPRVAVAPPTTPFAAPLRAPAIGDEAGAGAVEVAAMLGDSVVAVKHCMDPRGGQVRPMTYGLFAVGVLGLLVAAGVFVSSVATAAQDKAAFTEWTTVLKRPARAFRAHQGGAGIDTVALGSLALGLFAVTAGLLRAKRERQSPFFRIGSAPGVEVAATAPTEAFPLVAPAGDDFVCNVGSAMEGELILDGVSTPIAALAGEGRARPSALAVGALEIPLPARARLRVRSGLTTFLVSAVTPPRRAAAPGLAMLERRTLGYFAGALAVHLGIVAVLGQIPVDDGSAGLDVASVEDLGIKAAGAAHDETPPPPPEKSTGDGAEGDQNVGAAMALAEGKAGRPTSTAEQAHMQMEKRAENPQLARAQAIEDARSAGILGSSMLSATNITSMTATADMSSGFDSATMWGGMYGASGEQNGTFGMGRNGFGPGGGCGGTGCGIIGTGNYGTIGTGTHAGEGWNGNHGHGGLIGRDSKVPHSTEIGHPTGGGDYDAALIRRYVRRNYEKISYCYEKQLLSHPSLQGQILVRFFITPTGAVTQSDGSGFDGEVASCVAAVVGSIQFPKSPTGGGSQVSYPFTFRNSGTSR